MGSHAMRKIFSQMQPPKAVTVHLVREELIREEMCGGKICCCALLVMLKRRRRVKSAVSEAHLVVASLGVKSHQLICSLCEL